MTTEERAAFKQAELRRSQPCREDEAYDAGRLAGYEEGLAASVTPPEGLDVERLARLLREAINVVHQTDSIRSHADPNDKTGWNVHGIETCEDGLCVDALAALAGPSDEATVVDDLDAITGPEAAG